ncbi:hypothetical protein [Streptosporangium sp. CA-115845]|uniref:hypothetical protein n=1 Tax=Streptosporangium sp. CA-115845 TaxID=3240071 RepID=UPI003D8A5CD5
MKRLLGTVIGVLTVVVGLLGICPPSAAALTVGVVPALTGAAPISAGPLAAPLSPGPAPQRPPSAPPPSPGSSTSPSAAPATPTPQPSILQGETDPWCDNMIGSGIDPNCLYREIKQSLLTLISETTIWLSTQITTAIEEHGQLDLNRAWFDDLFGLLRVLAAMCALIALLVSVLFAALSRDAGEIGRTLVGVLRAGVTTGLIITIVMLAHRLIDEFCVMILGTGGWESITQALLRPAGYLWTISTSAGNESNPFVLLLLLSVAMLFALGVIWIEMIIRRMLIDLCVMMWPLAASGSIWSGARVWTRRLADSIASLLIVKLIIVLLLKMASALLINADSADDLLLAAGLYWLGAFSPFMVMKIIGLVQGALNPGHSGEGLRQVAAAGVGAAATKALGVGPRIAALARGQAGGAMRGGGRTPMPALTEPSTAKATTLSPKAAEKQDESTSIKPISSEMLQALGYEPRTNIPPGGTGTPASQPSSPAAPAPGRNTPPASAPTTPPSTPSTPVPATGTTPGNGGGGANPPGAERPREPASPLPPLTERTYRRVPPALLPALGDNDPPAPRSDPPSPPPPIPEAPLAGLRSYEGVKPIPDPSAPSPLPPSPPVPPPSPPSGERP